jgi:DNA-binding XRE family transcriptional regulator
MTNQFSRLPEIRKAAGGLSQQAVAERAGCSISTVRLVEQWGVKCSSAMAQKIAEAVGCEPDQLWSVEG